MEYSARTGGKECVFCSVCEIRIPIRLRVAAFQRQLRV